MELYQVASIFCQTLFWGASELIISNDNTIGIVILYMVYCSGLYLFTDIEYNNNNFNLISMLTCYLNP